MNIGNVVSTLVVALALVGCGGGGGGFSPEPVVP